MPYRRTRPRVLRAGGGGTLTGLDIGASNTGHTNAPGYAGLTSLSGPFTTSDTTVSFKDIPGAAVGSSGSPVSNVEFYGCRFRATGDSVAVTRLYGDNIRFRYCTFMPAAVSAPPVTYAESYQYGIAASGGFSTFVDRLLVEFCDIWGGHNMIDLADRSGNPLRTIRNNYIHDSAATGGVAHVDFIGDLDEHGPWGNLEIIGNNLVGTANSSILGLQYGGYSDMVIEDNLFGGGGYTINIAGSGTGNIFRRNYLTTLIKPVFGPLQGGMAWNAGGNLWRQNRWKVPSGAEWGTPGNDGKFWLPDTSDASALGWSDASFVSSSDYTG